MPGIVVNFIALEGDSVIPCAESIDHRLSVWSAKLYHRPQSAARFPAFLSFVLIFFAIIKSMPSKLQSVWFKYQPL